MNQPVALFLCSAVLMLLPGCETLVPTELSRFVGGGMSDEEQIARVLDEVQLGIENRRIYQVLAHVSRNYRDRAGRDYNGLRDDLSRLIRNYRNIRITRTPPRIQVRGDRARVLDTFGTIADSIDPLQYPPMNLQGQVVLLLERFGNKWQIMEWGPVN